MKNMKMTTVIYNDKVLETYFLTFNSDWPVNERATSDMSTQNAPW
jgi:hypothetical protein